MKFKFHWGWGVGIVYSTFVVIFLGILLWSTQLKFDLEDKDYYQKELSYQKQIDKIQRTQNLPEKIKIEIIDSKLVIKFPDFNGKGLTGKINFYRPSDSKLDFENSIIVNPNREMILPTSQLTQGLWKLKINFSVDGIEYYQEEALKV
jgi:hypothetical protein